MTYQTKTKEQAQEDLAVAALMEACSRMAEECLALAREVPGFSPRVFHSPPAIEKLTVKEQLTHGAVEAAWSNAHGFLRAKLGRDALEELDDDARATYLTAAPLPLGQ